VPLDFFFNLHMSHAKMMDTTPMTTAAKPNEILTVFSGETSLALRIGYAEKI
jgi:hypothetical protein